MSNDRARHDCVSLREAFECVAKHKAAKAGNPLQLASSECDIDRSVISKAAKRANFIYEQANQINLNNNDFNNKDDNK